MIPDVLEIHTSDGGIRSSVTSHTPHVDSDPIVTAVVCVSRYKPCLHCVQNQESGGYYIQADPESVIAMSMAKGGPS